MTSWDLFSLRGRVSIVTGGAGLLGRQHATALAAAGSHVAIGDCDGDRAAAVAEQLEEAHGTPALGLRLDVTAADSLSSFREAVLARWGRIDVLVNNAAIDDKVERSALADELALFENYPLALFRRMLEVNVTGVFLASQILGAPMQKSGSGSIVNIASTYGLVGPDPALYRDPGGQQRLCKSPAYPASKGAVLAFTRYLAAAWAPTVRVNSLSPGGVRNGQEEWFVENYERHTPLARMASPWDYQGAIIFLASDASAYMTGANLVVDGGFTAW